MAKQKRWAVKTGEGFGYYLFLGPKPRQPKHGWSKSQRNCFAYIDLSEFEEFMPECYHLPCWGGPVEIRFADEA